LVFIENVLGTVFLFFPEACLYLKPIRLSDKL